MRTKVAIAAAIFLGLTGISHGQSLFAVDSYVGGFFVVLLWIGTGVIASLEWRMASTNNQRYLRAGIPVFCLEKFCEHVNSSLPSFEGLRRMTSVKPLPNIHFQAVSTDEYAFADEINFQKKQYVYGPVMRGVIHFDNECSRIVVKGLMNWFPLAFAFAWLCSLGFTPIGLTGVSAVVALYVYQAIRYFQVTQAVVDVWASEVGNENR